MHGVGEVCGDQGLVCHFYYSALQGTKITDTYPVEGLDTHDDLTKQQEEPTKDLIFVPLADRNPEHIVRINSNLDQVTKNQPASFLQENADIFAWTPINMMGTDPSIISHQLNMDIKHQSFKQK